MIEVWLQTTCDGCGETVNSDSPNMTKAEERKILRTQFGWRSYTGLLDYCRVCVDNGTAKTRTTIFGMGQKRDD